MTLVEIYRKAINPALVPTKIIRKDGVAAIYYRRTTPEGKTFVRKFKIPDRSDLSDPDFPKTLHSKPRKMFNDIEKVKRWGELPTAKHLSPQDVATTRFVKEINDNADNQFQAEEWTDPVGGGERKLKAIRDPEVLKAIQDRLDKNATHEGRAVTLLEAYEMEYEHARL
jgi:hypothetical protein